MFDVCSRLSFFLKWNFRNFGQDCPERLKQRYKQSAGKGSRSRKKANIPCSNLKFRLQTMSFF